MAVGAATALGWKSLIFELGSGTMDDVSKAIASGASIGTPAKATRAGVALDHARTTWNGVLGALRGGGPGDDAARGMQEISRTLTSVRNSVPGRVSGHVQGAANEAASIRDVLRGAGSSNPIVDSALESRIWNFRYHLDEAWQELGMAKVMGELR